MTLVDRNDRVVGQRSREEAHQPPGKLHRAVLVVVFNPQGRILLARRGKGKLWEGIWDGTVATHVYPEETPEKTGQRGLLKELGLKNQSLKKHGFFVYRAECDDIGVEYEVCHLFSAETKDSIKANKKEISALRWITKKDLEKEIKKNPSPFSPWLVEALKRI